MSAVSRIPALALAVTAAAAGAFAVGVGSSELSISRTIAAAIQRQPTWSPNDRSEPAASKFDPAYLHLTSHLTPAETATGAARPGLVGPAQLRLGDRVSFAAADGAVRSYIVVDVRPVWAGVGDDDAAPRMLLITANGSESAEPAAVVRFIVEDPATGRPASPPATSPPKPRAL